MVNMNQFKIKVWPWCSNSIHSDSARKNILIFVGRIFDFIGLCILEVHGAFEVVYKRSFAMYIE